MSLTTGSRLGPYEVLAKIGEGGMGEVYRARDARLNREVALKVLPDAFASDAERLARFTREAQTLATLNHPNIAHIHGFEDAAGGRALVMELVEGPTLDEVIAAATVGADGRLELSDVIALARQIADALEAAHDAGVIHRDLKPSNIKVRPDGTVKVLDFGLAKAAADASGPGFASTITSPAMTQPGMVLGTAAYMSPEQAKGRGVDKRADIWAFGVVLFEMVSGERMFGGETVTETIASVIKDPLNLDRMPADSPPALRRLIERCLERDPRLRLRDIGEARVALANPDMLAPAATVPNLGSPAIPGTTAAAPRRGRLAALSLAFAAIAGVAGWLFGAAGAPAPVSNGASFSAQIVPTPADAFAARSTMHVITFAPDGSLIYASTTAVGRQLYRKERASHVGIPIPGTDGAYGPFVSPDGRNIGFFADGKLKRVPIAGGAAQVVHDLRSSTAKDALALGWTTEVGPGGELGYGAAWLPDDTIVYGRMLGGLWRVQASGGSPTPVTKELGAGELAHRLPHALPDGQSLLMTVVRTAVAQVDSSIDVVNLTDGQRRPVMANATDGRYAGGRLLFARDGGLYSVGFDPVSGTTSGQPLRIADDVMHSVRGGAPGRASGAAQYATSDDGTLAVLGGGVHPGMPRQLAWVNASGRVDPWPIAPSGFLAPRLSPDGSRVALFFGDGVTLIDTREYLTNAIANGSVFPIWKPDGKGLVVAVRSAQQFLHELSLDGKLSPIPITTRPYLLWPSSVSVDGRWLAYVETNPATGNDVWIADLTGATPPAVVASTSSSETHPAISPDGKWLVYAVAEGGSTALHAKPLLGPGRAERITQEGGLPVWSDNGRTLTFVLSVADTARLGVRQIVRAPIEVADDRLRVGRHVPIATLPLGFGTPVGGYDVARDGRIIVTLNAPPPPPATPPPPPVLTVIFNAIR